MKTTTTLCSKMTNVYWTPTIAVYQWDAICGGNLANYFVVAKNFELTQMQGVKPGNVHVECIVDDFGRLVRAAQ